MTLIIRFPHFIKVINQTPSFLRENYFQMSPIQSYNCEITMDAEIQLLFALPEQTN